MPLISPEDSMPRNPTRMLVIQNPEQQVGYVVLTLVQRRLITKEIPHFPAAARF
jgi:hypothetical protein